MPALWSAWDARLCIVHGGRGVGFPPDDSIGFGPADPSPVSVSASRSPLLLLLSQAFSEYQVQQMTAIFMDQFGFNDEEFADQDDNIK